MSELATTTLERIKRLAFDAGGWKPLSATTGIDSSVVWRARKNLRDGRTDRIRFDFLFRLSQPYDLLPIVIYEGEKPLSFGRNAPSESNYLRAFFRQIVTTPNMSIREIGSALFISHSSLYEYAYTSLNPTLGRVEQAATALGFGIEALVDNKP